MISVIVPVYNAERYIDKCIKSILSQTYEEFELILVDDGSTDSSGEICKNYESQDKRVRYIYKENAGVSSARNEGLKVSKGDYITFVDSDDFIKEDMLEQLINSANADFSLCGYEVYDDAKEAVTEECPCVDLNGDIHDFAQNVGEVLPLHFILAPWSKLFKKEIIDNNEIQFPPGLSYGEDATFVWNYLLRCKTAKTSRYIGYSYRKHGNETLSGEFFLGKIDIDYTISSLIATFMQKHKVENYNRFLSGRFLCNFVSYAGNLIYSELSYKEKRKEFYEKFNKYKNNLGEPQHLAERIVIWAGQCKVCYTLLYLFRIRRWLTKRN